MIGLIIS